MEPGLIVAQVAYGLDHNAFTSIHMKIAASMFDFYEKSGFLTPKQLGYVTSILRDYSFPAVPAFPWRESKLPKMGEPIHRTEGASAPSSSADKKMAVPFGEHIKLRFPFDNGTVSCVRTLTGRRYDKEDRSWIIPYSYESVGAIISWGFELHPDIQDWYKANLAPTKSTITTIPGLLFPLRPFQLTGVEFIEERSGRALIGDEMGLGKTVQAIAWLMVHPEARPAVILCPASLKWNWYNEIMKFMGKVSVQVLEGKRDKPSLKAQIIIANYDIVPDDTEEYFTGKLIHKNGVTKKEKKRRAIPGTGWWGYLRDAGINTLIMDECHKLKDSQANRTVAVAKLAKLAPNVIGLSGTPFLNRPVELYSPLHMINPYVFPSFTSYAQKYCGRKKTQWGWDNNGATNIAQLHSILTNTCMIRRLKKDVLPELPPKTRVMVPFDIDNMEEYQAASRDFLGFLRGISREKAKKAAQAEALTKISYLKQLSAKGKLKAAIAWIHDFLESGQKLIVFAHHQDIVNAIYSTFEKVAVKVDGGVTGKNRQIAVDTFQTDEGVKLFVANLVAGSEGLTLTAASDVAFLEYGWTPGGMMQAEDRAHRIGQNDSVTAWYLTGKNTIDEAIITLIEKKACILDGVLDGKDSVLEGSIYRELLNTYMEQVS